MTRKTHNLDASGVSLGRLSVNAATLLMGKNKAGYLPYVDAGDFVVVNNFGKIKLTGQKMAQKKYFQHTGYIGNLKETPIKKVWEDKPQMILEKAVYRMLPNNKLRDKMIKRLKVNF